MKDLIRKIIFSATIVTMMAFGQYGHALENQDNEYVLVEVKTTLSENQSDNLNQKFAAELGKTVRVIREKPTDNNGHSFIKAEYLINRNSQKNDAYDLQFRLYVSHDNNNWDKIQDSTITTYADQAVNFSVTNPLNLQILTQDKINLEVVISPRTAQEIKDQFSLETLTAKECPSESDVISQARVNCCTQVCREITVHCCGAVRCCENTPNQDPPCCCSP